MKNETNNKPPRRLTGAEPGTVRAIPMELLHRSPYQVRREGDVSELAADIREHGLINPITVRVRPQGDGFEVVAGHRRWAAMHQIDPDGEAPCIVLDVDDRTAEELLVGENFVRSDLSIMEQAETVAQLTAHGRTAEECGKVCRRSVRWAHRMRAIGGIGEPWRGFLHAAGLPYSCALAVARLPESVRERAWLDYWAEISDELVADASALAEVADDWLGLKGRLASALEAAPDVDLPDGIDLTTDRGARSLLLYSLANEGNGGRFDLASPYTPLGGVFDRLHLLERAPFDCGRVCAKCPHRTDHAPDLFAEDDGREQPARCLDGDCWRRNVAAHVYGRAEAATRAGAQPAERQARVNDWASDIEKTWEAALEAVGGDPSRVTPIVETFDDPANGPTGMLYYRVAPDAAADGKAEEPAPAWKREPWEEWKPENPHWMPMLMGETREHVWFDVGLAIGAAEADPPNGAGIALALSGAGVDYFHVLVRCEYLRNAGKERRAHILDTIWIHLPPAEQKKLLEARKVYEEACKHLEKKAGADDE